jgi:hypothetical protein
MITDRNFQNLMARVKQDMYANGRAARPMHWQGMNVADRPEMKTYELMHFRCEVPLQGIEDLSHWRKDIEPNLPWADKHFQERVCGVPINPGVEWANWPWGNSADRFRSDEQFNHNYMERYWPRYAGVVTAPTRTPEDWDAGFMELDNPVGHYGIRARYGDLRDLLNLLVRDPQTRQAWLPIYFPEDVSLGPDHRKPCTLGYQFIMREGRMDVYYPLRSCDFVRHFRDDIYLTVRLLLWVLEQLRIDDELWHDVKPGLYVMHATSLHIFENDWYQLYGKKP